MAGESATGAVQQRLALLIGSPVLGLNGPRSDVETMWKVLEKRGFTVQRCVGADATREGIRRTWNDLIGRVSSEHVVVIYYSGHGGKAQSTNSHREYEFIVPFDFADSTSKDFRGILDIEIADLVQKTTDKTKNVTLVFDCCHSSQMAWDPWHGSDAARKSLRGIKRIFDLSEREDSLRDTEPIQGHAFDEVNQNAVRIFAAGAAESAWEYTDENHKRVSVFTRALAIVLNKGVPDGTTWRALLSRVCELVAYEFPNQRPWAEGPSNRVLFATDRKKLDSLPVTFFSDGTVLQGGRTSGVREGSVYTVMPATYDEPRDEEKLGEATVTGVRDLASDVQYSARMPEFSHTLSPTVLNTSPRAFIKTESMYKWPVSIPRGNPDFEQRIKQSKYLRVREERSDSGHLVQFCKDDTSILGFTRKDTMCISSNEIADAVLKAEQFAKAQHLLTLTGGSGKEFLQHDLDIQFKIASPEKIFRKDGSDSAREGQHALIALHNKGSETLYVSVFSVNVWGAIYHVNRTCPLGIRILPNRKREIGQNFDFRPESERISGLRWPESLPRDRPVPETLVFIVTKEKIDLRDFAQPRKGVPRDKTSGLQELAHHLSFSSGHELPEGGEVRVVPYDVQRISWTLHPELRTSHSQPERTSSSAVTINGNLVNLDRSFPNNLFSDAVSVAHSDYILVQTNESLRRAQLKELDMMGATLQERISNRLYLFHYKPGDLQRFRRKTYIMDAAAYPERVKVDLELQQIGRGDPESVRDIIIAFHENKSHGIDSIVDRLEKIAGDVSTNILHDREKIRMSVHAAAVFDLAVVDAVRAIQEVRKKVCFNNRARHTMKARIFYNNTAFNGNMQTVAVADTGLDTGDMNNIHPAFQGRITELIPIGPAGDAADSSGHGTHVCGSILGDVVHGANDVTHQGIAPHARLVLQALADDEENLYPGSLTDLFLDPYQRHGARIHNNSWGSDWTEEQLRYNEDSRDIDRFVWEHADLLICFAAGNDGETDPTLGGEAAAKNCLTVGAIDSSRPERHYARRILRGPDGICIFSSHGPTVEGRIKPDVVAPGASIFSTRSTLLDDEDTAPHEASADGYFMHLSGTSMATALVSGCAAILRQVLIGNGVQDPSAALMKALLINGADSFNQSDLWTEGFGCINLKNSVVHVREPDTAGILVGSPFEAEGYRTFSLPDDMPSDIRGMTLKVTLAYTDKAERSLCNNLNLIVKAADGAERHGNMGTDSGFDNFNNVEQVVWKEVPPGYVEITVRAVEILTTEQSFALVWRIFRGEE